MIIILTILSLLNINLYAQENDYKTEYKAVEGASIGASRLCQRPGVATDNIYKSCPMITDKDLNPVFESCLKKVRNSSQGCQNAYEGVVIQRDLIKEKFQEYQIAQKNKKNNDGDKTKKAKKTIAEIEAELNKYLSTMNRVVGSDCKNTDVLATNALEVISMISPVTARLGLGIQTIYQSLSGIFKKLKKRSDLSKKLKLCDFNIRMKIARQSMCEAVYFHRKRINEGEAVANNIKAAENKAADYYDRVDGIKDMVILGEIESPDPQVKIGKILGISTSLNTSYIALGCSDSLEFCRSIALMRDNYKRASQAKNKKSLEQLLAISIKHAQLMEVKPKYLEELGMSINEIQAGYNFYVYKIRADLVNAYKPDATEEEKAKEEVFLFTSSTRYNATPLVKIITDMRDTNMYNPKKDSEIKSFCDSSACFWADANITDPQDARSINWKNIAGIDMSKAIKPQSIELKCSKNSRLSDKDNNLLRFIMNFSEERLSCNDKNSYNDLMNFMKQSQQKCPIYSIARCNLNCSSEVTDVFDPNKHSLIPIKGAKINSDQDSSDGAR